MKKKKRSSHMLRAAVLLGFCCTESGSFSIGTATPAGTATGTATAPSRRPHSRRRRAACCELSIPHITACYAKRAAVKGKVVDEGSQGIGDQVHVASAETIRNHLQAVAVLDDADLLDVDQEPKPAPTRRGRKAGTAAATMTKSKRRTGAAEPKAGGDDDAAAASATAEEDLLHWTLESDRAVVQYRYGPIAAEIDGGTPATADGISLPPKATRKRSSTRRSPDKAAELAANAAAPGLSAAAAVTPWPPVASVRFVVRGAPRPLVRHRVSTFRMYNPSAKAQKSFRTVVRTLLSSALLLTTTDGSPGNGHDGGSNRTAVVVVGGGGGESESESGGSVLFPTESLAVSIAFRTRRPLNHFAANRRGTGRLRPSAPPQTSVTRSDVDNLAKFVLDSLNGLLYDDDRQVCSLHATKILDNDGTCLGSTEVCVRVLGDDDLPALLDRSFQLF